MPELAGMSSPPVPLPFPPKTAMAFSAGQQPAAGHRSTVPDALGRFVDLLARIDARRAVATTTRNSSELIDVK